MSTHQFGTYTFEELGPGFVVFKIQTDMVQNYLLELKLTKPKKMGSWRVAYEWSEDFGDFLQEHGYTNPRDVVKAMRSNGVVMSSAQAIIFRLRFL